MADFNFIEASSDKSNDFNFGSAGSVFKLLNGNDNNFNSIWCGPYASLISGIFYVGRANDLTIIRNDNGQAYIEDYFSKNQKGSTGETLEAEDSVDINVTY